MKLKRTLRIEHPRCLWCLDALLFLADSHQMGKHAGTLKLPTLMLGPDGRLETGWTTWMLMARLAFVLHV